MSAPPHDSWPVVGSVWGHWSDVLLATQLAALRSGFTAIGKYWRFSSATELTLACLVQRSTYRSGGCTATLMQLEPVDATDLSGAWMVKVVRADNLDGRQHGNHSVGIGTSKGFKKSPSKPPKLALGTVVKDWKSMHLLEASFRSTSRLDGRFLCSYPQRESNGAASQNYSYFLSCVLTDRCTFYIHFASHEQVGGSGWKCTKLYPYHSCVSTAALPTESLQKLLSFWPAPDVRGDCVPYANRWVNTADISATNTDQHLGDYPVLPVGEDGKAILPILPNSKLQARLGARRSSLSRAVDTLSAARRTVLNLKTTLAAAECVDDLDEAKRIKIEIPAAEKRVRKKERKVAKRHAKVEQLKEKIAADIMERKKLRGEKK